MENLNVSKEIVMKKVNEIKPYVRNPRVNDITVDKLVKIIPMVGFNVPLVIDKNGIIVKGHARFRAGIRLGMEEFPCIISDGNDEQNKFDRIADNRISEFSEWVMDNLREELSEIKLDVSELDIEVHETSPEEIPLGVDRGSIDTSMTSDIGITTVPKKFIKVICEKCGHIQFVENNVNVFVGNDKTPKVKPKEELI